MNIGERAASDDPARRPRDLFRRSRIRACATTRLWGVWGIWPDGRDWQPVLSARSATARRFISRRSFPTATSSSRTTTTSTTTASARCIERHRHRRRDSRISSAHSRTTIRRYSATVGAGFPYPFTIPFTPRGGLYTLDAVHARRRRSRADRRRRRRASASSRIRRARRTTICSWSGRRVLRTISIGRRRCRTTTPASTSFRAASRHESGRTISC